MGEVDFYSESADDVWRQAAKSLLNRGAMTSSSGRGGATLELLHAKLSISDPRKRWVISRFPAMNIAFALAEAIWILSGRSDAGFITAVNGKYRKFAGSADRLHGAYGYRLRSEFDIDQLQRAYQTLNSNHQTRQVVLQYWNPNLDFPSEDGSPVDPDIPCNICSMLKVRDGKLHWTQVLRSNDIQLGVPHNIVQFTFIQEVLAGWLGIETGEYVQICDSLHCYEHDIPLLKKISTGNLADLSDSPISLPKPDSERNIQHVVEVIDTIIGQKTAAPLKDGTARLDELSQPFKDILLIICAELFRRRGLRLEATNAVNQCTNLLYVRMWEAWIARLKGQRLNDRC